MRLTAHAFHCGTECITAMTMVETAHIPQLDAFELVPDHVGMGRYDDANSVTDNTSCASIRMGWLWPIPLVRVQT